MANPPAKRSDSYIPSEDDWGEPPATSSFPVLRTRQEISDAPAKRPQNLAFLIIALIAGLIVFGLVIKAAFDRDDEYNKLRPEVDELDIKRGDYK